MEALELLKMKNKVTIYSISHPVTKKIFYVGQTLDLSKRIIGHKYDSCSNALYSFMKELKEQKINPVFNILEECEVKYKFERELFWINKFSSEGYSLLNRQANSLENNESMPYRLTQMKIGETADFTGLNYDSLISTKSRLKRNGKGEWQSILSKDSLLVKRTK